MTIPVSEKLRFVQMTPLGSACSICFGIGIADNMKPGSIKGLQMVVKDAQAVHDGPKKLELILVTSTHKLGVSSFILMIRMATLGPFRKYLRAANLKSRSKVFKATYAFILIHF
jgi:hypothetical protein